MHECLIHAIREPWIKDAKDRKPPEIPAILKD
jgi:hypothetical protein